MPPVIPLYDAHMPAGRPPIPPEERADARIMIRCRDDQKAAYEQMAEREGLSLSAWMKMVADKAVKKVPKR